MGGRSARTAATRKGKEPQERGERGSNAPPAGGRTGEGAASPHARSDRGCPADTASAIGARTAARDSGRQRGAQDGAGRQSKPRRGKATRRGRGGAKRRGSPERTHSPPTAGRGSGADAIGAQGQPQIVHGHPKPVIRFTARMPSRERSERVKTISDSMIMRWIENDNH